MTDEMDSFAQRAAIAVGYVLQYDLGRGVAGFVDLRAVALGKTALNSVAVDRTDSVVYKAVVVVAVAAVAAVDMLVVETGSSGFVA